MASAQEPLYAAHMPYQILSQCDSRRKYLSQEAIHHRRLFSLLLLEFKGI